MVSASVGEEESHVDESLRASTELQSSAEGAHNKDKGEQEAPGSSSEQCMR